MKYTQTLDALIIGAGPSGLSALIKLKKQGVHNVRILDMSQRIGGTWANNDYPGLRCDIPSEMYSLGYAPNPQWSRTYAPQAEIQQYLEGVAQQFNITDQIQLNTEVTAARWQEKEQLWHIETAADECFKARFFIPATGFIGEAKMPEFPGQSEFKGTMFHSGLWNHRHDLSGETVAVIGSGASAIQFVPAIQPRVKKLINFQRTPSWVLPKPDVAIPSPLKGFYQRFPNVHRLVRETALLAAEPVLPTFEHEPILRSLSHPLGLLNIRRSVRDKTLRKQLKPDHTLGCKRPMFSNDWYKALDQDNVEVVFKGIERISQRGVIDSDGKEYPVDTIIYGTGYAVDDPAIYQRITGRHGETLADTWNGEPRAYQGMAIHGFPNLFMMLGPNSHSLVGSVMWTSEHQGIYIAQAIRKLLDSGEARMEVKESVQKNFNQRIETRLDRMPIRPEICKSYYLDAKGRNRFVWPEYGFNIKKRLTQVNLSDYQLG
ncbi:monooxygenase [gamma proteobacterium HTCC5015]|nr:monooxygenase [gamma proteobacterium HTCC5015]